MNREYKMQADFIGPSSPPHKITFLNAETQQEQSIESARIVSFYPIDNDFFHLYYKDDADHIIEVRVDGGIKAFHAELNGDANKNVKDAITNRIRQQRNDRLNVEIGRLDENYTLSHTAAESEHRHKKRELRDAMEIVEVDIADATINIRNADIYPNGEGFEKYVREHIRLLENPNYDMRRVEEVSFNLRCKIQGKNGLAQLIQKKMEAEIKLADLNEKLGELVLNKMLQKSDDETNYKRKREELLAAKANPNLSQEERGTLISTIVQYKSKNGSEHRFFTSVGAYIREGSSIADRNEVVAMRQGERPQDVTLPEPPSVTIGQRAFGPDIKVWMPR